MVPTEGFGANIMTESELIEPNPLNQQDSIILQSYSAVVDGLAALIGEHCEIVLHALDDLNKSAIKIANGENTGRQVGSPITDLALRMLRDIEGSERNFSRAYFTRAKSGTLMKSITVAIRNGDNRIIGLLCININLDAPFSQVLQAFIPDDQAKQAASSVNFASDVDELVDQTVERTVEEVNADKSVSNNTKNRQIVMALYDKGIFDIKDAINRVAARLNISKHTVYLYVRQRKTEEAES
ncbi:transcriptional regulator [Salinivibrio sp. VYel9]|uniref:Transcriptional regulator n=2 Tax=Vibrionaceae TaxID=641 RepID=A0ABX3KEQ7_9GAMM|nr:MULTISPECIES: transcriptional regulator [Salinivibrio]MPS32732.1 transcriptional regulator [Salinivibrio sp. VYel7]MPX90726.1 transcriptional regulator [Salinivibrio sp. VYel1]MPX94122.1 transcriptional regulator [Salinivibrio sp. VYel9]MPX96830.1 transcriptional regulator [Salinivibrio sp. VYel6]MPY00018.1 transcriptional regulator [Salinivibrio sp. VYel4]MPY03086.1 transcriptional regulator [Salinivibrio sp. VYel5]MPY06200.1 transcriptional regulator [Salinivibrio sp. VYel8]MPY14285.1 